MNRALLVLPFLLIGCSHGHGEPCKHIKAAHSPQAVYSTEVGTIIDQAPSTTGRLRLSIEKLQTDWLNTDTHDASGYAVQTIIADVDDVLSQCGVKS